jgi:hypothetical protein
VQEPREIDRVGRHFEAGRVEQAFEQLRPSTQLFGQCWSAREQFGQQLSERRTRLQQPEQVDAARQPVDDVAEAVERMAGVGADGDRLKQCRQHRLKRLLGRGGAQRSRLAGPPVGNVARCGRGIDKPKPNEFLMESLRIVRQLGARFGLQAVEQLADALDTGSQQIDELGAASKAVKLRDIVQCIRLRGQHMRLRVIHHLHAMLDSPKQAVSVGKVARFPLVQPLRGEQRVDGVQGCRSAH